MAALGTGARRPDSERYSAAVGDLAAITMRLAVTTQRFAAGGIGSVTIGPKEKGRQLSCRPSIFSNPLSRSYLMLLRFVAKDSFAMKTPLHQLEPRPPGLMLVTLDEPVAVWSEVKALQSPLLRFVS